MERTITYQISESEHGLRVEQYLRHKGYSYQNLTQLKKMPESILINGIWSYMRSTLSCGDTLTVHIQESEYSEHIPPVQLPLDIIYEDDDLLVVNKPAGMPIHPSLNNYKNSLANALMYYYKEQGKPFIFRCTNRLDRDTSGLTVIAKHLVSSSILSFMAVRHEIHREYLAIVRGTVSPASGTINAPLARTGSSIIERKVDFEHGEHAVTHYKVLKEQNQHSLVSLILETGRTHQIRVHMASIGCNLVGDRLYEKSGKTKIVGLPPETKAFVNSFPRQALHAASLGFVHPRSGEFLQFSVDFPADLHLLLDTCLLNLGASPK